MVYKHYYGITKERISKLALLSIALLFAFTTAIGILSSTTAASHLLDPFTQEELDNNWVTDRVEPSGGVESVSFDGRDDVAKIGIVSAEASELGSWYGYEGIKKVADHGTSVQVDMYVPSEWTEIPVNAGFWASDDPLSAYPIIVFRNADTVDAGFYTWDGVGGWAPVDSEVNYNGWNTLAMTLDGGAFNYFVNGQEAGSIAASGDTIGQVFLNQYNYGALDQSIAIDYEVYWHIGVEEVELPPAKAAPAVASELLDEAGIKARYGHGRNGGNYIADVAREMDRGAYFDGVAKENVVAYRCVVAKFLEDKGADVNADELCYTFVETVEVDSALINGADSSVLEEGAEYSFVASGTWVNGNVHAAVDAVCRLPVGATSWEVSEPRSLRLQIDEEYATWGTECAEDNVYQLDYTGEGIAVNFRINDGQPPVPSWYNDNDGSLFVDIFQKLY